MATFTELQALVQSNIIDLPTAVLDQIPDLINAAMRELQVKHDFKVCETLSSVFTTTEHTRVLGSVPSNWSRWRERPEVIDASGRVRTLAIYHSRQEAEREFGSTAGGEHTASTLAGAPKALILSEPNDTGAMNFEVFPLPDENSLYANGNYRIRVPYYRFLPDLSAGSDTNWFTVNADEFLVEQATAKGFFANWDTAHGVEWTQRAAASLRDVIKQDKMMRMSEVSHLVPYRSAFGRRYPGSDVA